MDDATQPTAPANTETQRPARPDLDHWRGDIRDRPPTWRRRPRSERVRELWRATRPLLARIGEGQSWT